MIGDELIQQVILATVIRVTLGIRVDAQLINIVIDIINRNIPHILVQFPGPELVRLGKDGKAVVTVLRRVELDDTLSVITGNRMRDGLRLVLTLIYIILDLIQLIQQVACGNQFGHYRISALIGVNHILQQGSHGVSAGSHHVMHAVNHAVDCQDIMVYPVNHTVVDKDTVRIRGIGYHQFPVVHIGHLDLGRRRAGRPLGKRAELEEAVIVSAVDNTVVHNNLANRIQLRAVSKGIPRGLRYQFLLHQGVQIQLDGIIGRCENRVIATCRQQLEYRGPGNHTHGNLLQQLAVLTVLRMFLQVARNDFLLEDIT